MSAKTEKSGKPANPARRKALEDLARFGGGATACAVMLACGLACGIASRICAGSGENPSGSASTGTDWRVSFSISRRKGRSSRAQSEIAMPEAPARAVRPMRWT